MNVLFTSVFILCTLLTLLSSPKEFLPALLSAASSSGALCVALLSSYCVFCGLSALWEASGITSFLAKVLKKPVDVLFNTKNEEAKKDVCVNVAANLLGLGAIATAYGVSAATSLQNERGKKRDYVLAVLFTLNAASLQCFPTSVVALRTSAGSENPSSVVLPILLSSAFFLLVALPLTVFIYKPRKKKIAALPSERFDRTRHAATVNATHS